ncbi:MAG: hypothetical protein Q9192_003121 [Flavoplaca navasiana]
MEDMRRSYGDFVRTALKDYEHRLKRLAVQLQQAVGQSDRRAINVSRLFYLYSFDVMSDLAFGEPLHMLTSNSNHFLVGLLQDGMDLLGPLSPVPWLVRIGLSIPGVASNFKTLLTWSAKKLEHRMQNAQVMSWLLEASRKEGSLVQDQHWLRGDAFALIVAGSDTVASTLISIFYHLTEDPTQIEKLRSELENVDSPFATHALAAKPHLNGRYNCIGKPLALAQIRSVVALLISKFDVHFAPGEDHLSVWKDLKDQFNSHPGKLHLVFSERVWKK